MRRRRMGRRRRETQRVQRSVSACGMTWWIRACIWIGITQKVWWSVSGLGWPCRKGVYQYLVSPLSVKRICLSIWEDPRACFSRLSSNAGNSKISWFISTVPGQFSNSSFWWVLRFSVIYWVSFEFLDDVLFMILFSPRNWLLITECCLSIWDDLVQKGVYQNWYHPESLMVCLRIGMTL